MRRLHGPPAPASAATATNASLSSPSSPSTESTAMPRMPSPPRSAPDADARPVFTGAVWLPAAPSYFSFGLGAKWTTASLTMWLARVVDDASARPMLHLRLGDRAAVVATGIHPRGTPAMTQDPQAKKRIQVDVKAVEDVRRAVLYHTAAARATLSFYVDTDVARAHLVHLIQQGVAAAALSSPAAAIRPPTPTPTPTPSVVDTAFAQLENACAMHQRGHVVDALTAYAVADHALATAAAYPPPPRGGGGLEAAALRTRIVDARHQIRAAAEALEMEKALPRAAVAVATTTVDVSEPTSVAPARPRTDPRPASPPRTTIDARLVGLQTFAHARDVDRAQRERRVAADDLSLRLHALRNDTPTAPSVESLQERLERLRGGLPSPPASDRMHAWMASTTVSTLSPVDQIIQQAMDEVAMGIADEDHNVDGVDHDDGRSPSSSDHSDSSSEDEDCRRRP